MFGQAKRVGSSVHGWSNGDLRLDRSGEEAGPRWARSLQGPALESRTRSFWPRLHTGTRPTPGKGPAGTAMVYRVVEPHAVAFSRCQHGTNDLPSIPHPETALSN